MGKLPIMRILGIETSCDETGVAIYDHEHGLMAHALHSQIERHKPYGGTVPELASRDHIQKITPLVQQTLKKAHSTGADITGIAYTSGPGLMGALLVGACFAKSLAFAWNIQALAIHHMEGHLLAPLLEDKAPEFPFLALLVSGGHTMLVKVQKLGEYTVLGETLDDAAGEAFDKTARLLDLPYPGGPEIAKAALSGNPQRFDFPRPLTKKPGLDFSFSGLKTATRHALEKTQKTKQDKIDIAASFQAAVVDSLVLKCKRAVKETGLKRLVIAGGVGANIALRTALTKLMDSLDGQMYYPRLEFCTDNGAMIAYAGFLRFQRGEHDPTLAIKTYPRWDLEAL